MTSFTDSYATAIRSSNLRSRPETSRSDSDVIGAAGLAARQEPLAMALTRLFLGDNRAATSLVQVMVGMLIGKAWHLSQDKLPATEAQDIAQAVLAWHRHGTCKPCGGHGMLKQPDAPMLSGKRCQSCRGSGRVLFDVQFRAERLSLARWLLVEIEREQAVAGQAAMRALAPMLHI